MTYPQELGYVMMVQVLWVPDQQRDLDALKKAEFGITTKYGNGHAVVDGGKESPAAKFGGDDAPHKLYPFFAYSEVYYKDMKDGLRSLRSKDYASAAKNHTALVFNCNIVAKLQPEHRFGIIGSFSWGVGQHGEIILAQRDGMTDVSKNVLAKEYEHCKFETLGGTNAGTPINTKYTPFEKKNEVKGKQKQDKYNMF